MPSLKEHGWTLFDQVVAEAPFQELNPWEDGVFRPDYDTLIRLLGVPLALRATSQSGVPALAFDVWIAYELRRAGFHPDRVWPRATSPRVLPAAVSALIESLPHTLRADIEQRLARGLSGGTAGSVANLLGKNYVKQVDVVMSTWQTGPELMISTKRMDSSFGKTPQIASRSPTATPRIYLYGTLRPRSASSTACDRRRSRPSQTPRSGSSTS